MTMTCIDCDDVTGEVEKEECYEIQRKFCTHILDAHFSKGVDMLEK